MPLLLTTDAPTANRRLMLRVGQEARVGRSEWMEMSLPGDDSLAEEHFVVRCSDDAVVETLDSDASFIVRGEQVKRMTLSSAAGEKATFIAGNTKFVVNWTPDLTCSSKRPAKQADATQCETQEVNVAAQMRAIGQTMSLSPDAVDLVEPGDQLDHFVDRLMKSNLADDAVRYIAGVLPASIAVRWAMEVADASRLETSSLRDAISTWIDDPSEPARRTVQNLLSVEPCDNVTKWIAQAVVYSGGSLAPDGQPIIKPPPHLSAVAIVTAHRWAISEASHRGEAVNVWIDSGKQWIEEHLTECVAWTTSLSLKSNEKGVD